MLWSSHREASVYKHARLVRLFALSKEASKLEISQVIQLWCCLIHSDDSCTLCTENTRLDVRYAGATSSGFVDGAELLCCLENGCAKPRDLQATDEFRSW